MNLGNFVTKNKLFKDRLMKIIQQQKQLQRMSVKDARTCFLRKKNYVLFNNSTDNKDDDGGRRACKHVKYRNIEQLLMTMTTKMMMLIKQK